MVVQPSSLLEWGKCACSEEMTQQNLAVYALLEQDYACGNLSQQTIPDREHMPIFDCFITIPVCLSLSTSALVLLFESTPRWHLFKFLRFGSLHSRFSWHSTQRTFSWKPALGTRWTFRLAYSVHIIRLTCSFGTLTLLYSIIVP